MTTKPRKPRKKTLEKLLQDLRKIAEELEWEIHIPLNEHGQVVPYAILGRPLFANLVKDHLDKSGINKILSRTFVEDIKEK